MRSTHQPKEKIMTKKILIAVLTAVGVGAVVALIVSRHES